MMSERASSSICISAMWAHKQQTCCTGVTICMLEWEWKKTRFYKVSWQNSKCHPRRSLSPSDHPRPSIPQFHISNPDSLVLGPASITSYNICSTVTLWVGTDAFFGKVDCQVWWRCWTDSKPGLQRKVVVSLCDFIYIVIYELFSINFFS